MALVDWDYTEEDQKLAGGSGSYKLLAPGVYRVAVTEVEDKENSKGTGRFYQVTYQVVEGDSQGKTVRAYLNYLNENTKAQAIGRRQFLELAKALGFEKVTDTDDLIAITLYARIGIEGDFNRVEKVGATSDEVKGKVTPTPIKNEKLTSSAW